MARKLQYPEVRQILREEGHRHILTEAYLKGNFGDDVMLVAMARRHPEMTFIVPGEAFIAESFERQNNLIFVGGVKALQLARLARACHCYMVLGGSMFIDQDSGLRERIRRYLRFLSRIQRALMASWSGGFCVVIGANVGPLETKFGTWLTSAFFKLTRAVVVRDDNSLKWLTDIGVIADAAPDLAIGYLSEVSTEANRLSVSKDDVVGISVMRLPGISIEESADWYANVIDAVFDQHRNSSVRLFAAHYLAPSDEAVLMAICDKWGGRVTRCTYRGSVEGFIYEIAACSAFIGMRLHVSLAALCAGVPCIAVSYSAKVRNALQLIDPNLTSMLLREADDAGELARSLASLRRRSVFIADSVRQRSDRHLSVIADCFASRESE